MHRHRLCMVRFGRHVLTSVLIALSVSQLLHAAASPALDGQPSSHVERKPNEHSECKCPHACKCQQAHSHLKLVPDETKWATDHRARACDVGNPPNSGPVNTSQANPPFLFRLSWLKASWRVMVMHLMHQMKVLLLIVRTLIRSEIKYWADW